MGNNTIFYLGRGTKDRPLFPGRPRDRIAAKKHYVTSSRSAIVIFPSPVHIRECMKRKRRMPFKEETIGSNVVDIMEKAFNHYPMNSGGLVHELR